MLGRTRSVGIIIESRLITTIVGTASSSKADSSSRMAVVFFHPPVYLTFHTMRNVIFSIIEGVLGFLYSVFLTYQQVRAWWVLRRRIMKRRLP